MIKFAKWTTLTCLSLSLLACGNSENNPKWIPIISDMVTSEPYDGYAKNPNFKDGKTLQVPPQGTVPQNYTPYNYANGPEGASLASAELHNPFEATAENLARGQKVYESKCLVCHGVKGEGDGPIIGKFPNPPSYAADRVVKLTEGSLYHSISVGVGIMPAYAVQITPEDRWKVILYVQKLVAELKK